MNQKIYKNFSEEEALDLVKKRYENMEGKIPLTIKRLELSQDFQSVFRKMKAKSYPDWAIYMAILNVVHNYRINNSEFQPRSAEDYHKLWMKYMNEVETADDLVVPLEEFSEDKLEFAIDMYVMAFLKGQGYEFRRATPNVHRLRKFAEEKYKMFEYDIPHSTLFSFEEKSS